MDTAPFILTKTRLHAGLWEGELTASEAKLQPDVVVTHLDRPLKGVALTEIPGRTGAWQLRIAIPADLLSDGVQTVLISETRSGARLGAFTIISGEPLEDDIRAEVDLLRAELDLLKRAFRRHCLETL
jgi:hypothetical protein